jgi:peptidoglycan/xylan/chitin deacetylase (PgdA/CDA1 family)
MGQTVSGPSPSNPNGRGELTTLLSNPWGSVLLPFGMRINRRQLLWSASALCAAARPQVSITMDDVAWQQVPEPYRERANARILSGFEKHINIRAALFVTGSNEDSPQGEAIERSWSERGHLIGNHTWSHQMYSSKSDPAAFGADVLRCHRLVERFPGFRPFFRFPLLKEGATREKRDWMRAFLTEHGYRNGAVTIDASDWYYDRQLRKQLEADPRFDVNRFRQPYLDHIADRTSYYDELARNVTGRSVPHTLLIHFNLLNALFLGDLLNMFRRMGWELIDAAQAYQDEVFRRTPDTVPAGESLIWAIAKESGKPDLRYPGEDGEYEDARLRKAGLL